MFVGNDLFNSPVVFSLITEICVICGSFIFRVLGGTLWLSVFVRV